MVRIDQFVFGYRILRVKSDVVHTVMSRLIRADIPAEIREGENIYVRERDYLRVVKLLGKIEHTVSETRGVFGYLKGIRNKAAIIIATVVSVFIMLFTYDLVWDVRVDGNLELSDAAVVRMLAENGFSVGDRWSKSERSVIENCILSNCLDISWININRRGTVAYVTVLENTDNTSKDEEHKISYANIVSEVDCVIEDITVKKGKAMVKVGDAVKKGDLLIAGILPDEAGGKLCKAEGTVIGRVSDDICVEVNRNYIELSEKKEKIVGIRLKIFKFCANIFKNHRNLSDECDIIEEINVFSLFGKCLLPIELQIDYAITGTLLEKEYSDQELLNVVASRLRSETASYLRECDLISIRTHGDYTDTGYSMINSVVFTADVGECLPYEVSNK